MLFFQAKTRAQNRKRSRPDAMEAKLAQVIRLCTVIVCVEGGVLPEYVSNITIFVVSVRVWVWAGLYVCILCVCVRDVEGCWCLM